VTCLSTGYYSYYKYWVIGIICVLSAKVSGLKCAYVVVALDMTDP